MSYGTYADRVYVHPERYGVVKSRPNIWAVLHTSEGPEGTNAAEGLCSYLGRPGDRPNGRGGFYGSSYHVVFDTDRIIPAVPYGVVSYSAGGGNAQGIHGCFPGKSAQTREQWLGDESRNMIRQAAAWLLDLEAEFGIPVDVKISVADMQAGRKGLVDHHTVTLAFRKSTHTDIGVGFPWDVLAADIAQLRGGTPPLPPPSPGYQRIVMTDKFEFGTATRWDTRGFGGAGLPAGEYVCKLDGSAGKLGAQANLTIVSGGSPGYASAWASGPRPDTSKVNYEASGAIANEISVPLASDGSFRIYISSPAHIIVDLVGYYS